jgi:glycosyltransferase involved in cell wall biosynthesis
VTPHKVPDQSGSHVKLLDPVRRSPGQGQFDAIIIPTYREAAALKHGIDLARQAQLPLIVMCSRAARQREIIELAAPAGITVLALEVSSESALGIRLATSVDDELKAAIPGWHRDLSAKRNLGLVLARLAGWKRIMFLDDDIRGVTEDDVDALAAGLDDHGISALIPEYFPDNSVTCHAHRLGGGLQDVFASASGIGVRCDRDDLAFFPNIYNEDWFFFAEQAANRNIANVGVSQQVPYDPYKNPNRAALEEFGDLLAEGLYARLDRDEGIWGTDEAYWQEFIEHRMSFHDQVVNALTGHPEQELARRASTSVRAAQDQLRKITPEICCKFIGLWKYDLSEWRRYLTGLSPVGSIMEAMLHLELDIKTTPE